MVVQRERVRRCAGDQGTALVEAAILSPIFIYLLAGILEFGLTLNDYLSVTTAAESAARSASIMGNKSTADYQLILSFVQGSRALKQNEVSRVVVWHAKGAYSSITTEAPACASATSNANSVGNALGSPVPAGSMPPATYPGADTTGQCNVYTPIEISFALGSNGSTKFGCKSADYDRYYCPSQRYQNNTSTDAAGHTLRPADFVGIYVVYNHRYLTGLFGSSYSLAVQSIARLEPIAN
jgi:Flp pilus assembly protein TadG